MVTIQQAVLQVEAAKEELKSAKGSALEREKEIQLAKSQSQLRLKRGTDIGTISSQVSLAAAVGAGGVGREIKTRRRVARKEFKETRGTISRAREELETFESQFPAREAEIVGIESEISTAQGIQQKQQRTADAFRRARKIFFSTNPAAIFALSGREERAFFREFVAAKGRSITGPTLTEVQLQQSLLPELRNLPPTEIVALLPGSQIFAGQSIPIQVQSLQPLREDTLNIGFFEKIGVPTSITKFLSGETIFRGRYIHIPEQTSLNAHRFLSWKDEIEC